jgi:hypothetical protein
VRRVALLLVLAGAATLAAAAHTPQLTRDEERCQRVAGPTTDRVGAARARCVLRCERKAIAGAIDPSACLPPYDDRVRACIDAAERRAVARIAQACHADCPECYVGGDCDAFGRGAVDITGQVVDGLIGRVLCADPDPIEPAAARCRLVVGRALARGAVRMGRCFVRCRRDEERGRLGPGACTTLPLPERTHACLDGATADATAAITRGCRAVPPCLTPTSALVEALLTQISTDYESFLFCPSPSGAFVDG